jgi:hypothetical protein
LDALCVSPLPPEEDYQVVDGPILNAQCPDVNAIPKPLFFPALWREKAMNDCVLHWYRTDDGGYAMPLPEFGELVLRPQALEWLTSGEIGGKRVIAEAHKSFKNAFDSIERAMERDGGDILAAAIAEQQWASNDPTPLQEALLNSSRHTGSRQSIDNSRVL